MDVAYWLLELHDSQMQNANAVTITTLTFGIFVTSDETLVMLFYQSQYQY